MGTHGIRGEPQRSWSGGAPSERRHLSSHPVCHRLCSWTPTQMTGDGRPRVTMRPLGGPSLHSPRPACLWPGYSAGPTKLKGSLAVSWWPVPMEVPSEEPHTRAQPAHCTAPPRGLFMALTSQGAGLGDRAGRWPLLCGSFVSRDPSLQNPSVDQCLGPESGPAVRHWRLPPLSPGQCRASEQG